MNRPGRIIVLRGFAGFLLTAVLLTLQGCAAIGLTFFGAGLGVGASTATSYSIEGVAYRTFTAPLPQTHQATLTALKRMSMKVESDKQIEEGQKIVALANGRETHITLERLSPTTTRMRVNSKRGLLLRDRATAGEIITQAEDVLAAQTEKAQTRLLR